MCRPVPCPICHKTTWAGCGEHVEAALSGVALEDRCPGHHRAAGVGPPVRQVPR